VNDPDPETLFWRVGYFTAPVDFAPLARYEFNHRFDDVKRRFRSIYCAETAATALRELLCDYRPNAEAIRLHVERYGPDAVEDIPSQPVTASWRRQNVLQRVRMQLGGSLVDLIDVATRQTVETAHAGLLAAYGLDHLDMAQVMTKDRVVTQTIASRLYDEGAAAIRFASRLDGAPCIAVLEGRGRLEGVDAAIPLSDPPPQALVDVCGTWGLRLEPTD
jgi:hypothetical protein